MRPAGCRSQACGRLQRFGGFRVTYFPGRLDHLRFGVVMRLPILILASVASVTEAAGTESTPVERLVAREIHEILPPDGIGGAAVAGRVRGPPLFFNFSPPRTPHGRPTPPGSPFNLPPLRHPFQPP